MTICREPWVRRFPKDFHLFFKEEEFHIITKGTQNRLTGGFADRGSMYSGCSEGPRRSDNAKCLHVINPHPANRHSYFFEGATFEAFGYNSRCLYFEGYNGIGVQGQSIGCIARMIEICRLSDAPFKGVCDESLFIVC
jgi:hypothetical protein